MSQRSSFMFFCHAWRPTQCPMLTNPIRVFLAFHCHLSRNCHCVVLSLAVRTEWVIFFEAGTFSGGFCVCLNPLLSPLTNAGLSFPIHLVPIGLESKSPRVKSVIRTDHVAMPDWPGCLLPFMKLWIRINETQHCFISQHVCLPDCSLTVDGEMRAPVWPQQQHLGLLTLWPSPCFCAQETRTHLQRANRELQVVLQIPDS